jgi:hypothetical protein
VGVATVSNCIDIISYTMEMTRATFDGTSLYDGLPTIMDSGKGQQSVTLEAYVLDINELQELAWQSDTIGVLHIDQKVGNVQLKADIQVTSCEVNYAPGEVMTATIHGLVVDYAENVIANNAKKKSVFVREKKTEKKYDEEHKPSPLVRAMDLS